MPIRPALSGFHFHGGREIRHRRGFREEKGQRVGSRASLGGPTWPKRIIMQLRHAKNVSRPAGRRVHTVDRHKRARNPPRV